MLSKQEKTLYQWQLDVDGHGLQGQKKLKNSSVLISRCGGLGGVIAYELAAAGVGKLIVAHAGDIALSDLNRQLLMTYQALGTSRIASVEKRLKQLNPFVEVVSIAENINENNVEDLVAMADVVVDAAPIFQERFLMNQQAVAQNKPLVDCAMYELEAQITTIIPHRTACLSCLYPETPAAWRRRFPVFGAVSGAVACLGAMETIKLISGFGAVLQNKLLVMDLRDMTIQTINIQVNKNCAICQKK